MRVQRTLPTVLLLLGLWLTNLCAGCGEPPPLDMSLLTGDPCEPPCWQGLTPGVSTEEAVDEFVRTSELVDQTTLSRHDRTSGRGEVIGVGVHWWSSANTAGVPRQWGNNVMTRDGVVQEIMVFLDSEVMLADLLERYGEPHMWSVTWVAPDIPDLDVTLYYPDHGFTAWLRLPADDRWLRPDNKIRRVRYSRTVPSADFVELGPEAGYFDAYEADSLRDWQGYGIVWL